ncbi:hypothetical protein FOMPIDRAFT_1038842 [Fomitopsis schrenkii]|uniref:DUF6534 domain-containing protein n=1 Tax=Fomitopsis schrenkii TaxID=2126942 RepID=S8EXZ6_FOMSC|nr:hypothetical protein FOMPIDRAFT_1038842 [Fomitopsis schrenkii]
MESSDGINIGPYFGAFVLGIYLNILLYGVVVAGYYHYAHHSKDDTLLLRSFILFLFVADTLHTGLSVVYVYDGLVTHFVPAITGIISCAVHFFFAYRVKAISHRTWLSVIICVLAVASTLFDFAGIIAIRWPGMGGDKSMRNPAVKGLLSSWLITGVAADVLIAVSLVWHLHRRKSGFSDTDSLVNRIILLTVQTGVLTTTWAITDLALCLGSAGDTHEFFNFSLAKWYTIFLMSSLNNRGSWEPHRSKTSALSWKVAGVRRGVG